MLGNHSIQGRDCSHQMEVAAFLQAQLASAGWEFSLPHGWGKETYFARGIEQSYFVKLGAPVAIYRVMASTGLTPPVILSGALQDGTTLLVQPYIQGRHPTWEDFKLYLEQFAGMIGSMQRCQDLIEILPEATTEKHRELGLEALQHLRQKWALYKARVPSVAEEVDEKLAYLAANIEGLEGSGAVPCHHDICNANWLITDSGKIYLIDLDDMSMDDPAVDLGAILWWYYPAELRPHFLHATGYMISEKLQSRMRLRMAMHCLDILLPREHSFDRFDAKNFAANLADFRAILAGKENPQGYG